MTWVQSDSTISRHPKTWRVARLIDRTMPCVVGHLHCLWHSVAEFAPDGSLVGLSVDELERFAAWDGDSGAFWSALISAGFVDLDDAGNASIHDWAEYSGAYFERRLIDRERKRNERASRSRDAPQDISGQRQDKIGQSETKRRGEERTGEDTTGEDTKDDEARATRIVATDDVEHDDWRVQFIAETIASAPWVTDDVETISAQVERSFVVVPAFDVMAGPREAELFVRWKGYVKRPPQDWYRAWLNWIKRTVDQQAERAEQNNVIPYRAPRNETERQREIAKYRAMGFRISSDYDQP